MRNKYQVALILSIFIVYWKGNGVGHAQQSTLGNTGKPLLVVYSNCSEPYENWNEAELRQIIDSASNMFFYDAEAAAYFIRDMGGLASISWSPDTRRVLVYLEYAAVVWGEFSDKHCFPKARQSIPYLNYPKRTYHAAAVLIVDTREQTITPFIFPFVFNTLPLSMTWWDSDSIAILGSIVDGVLKNDDSGWTAVHLRDKSTEFFPIPNEVSSVLDKEAGGPSVIRRHHQLKLNALAFWRPNLTGSLDGTIFFDDHGSVLKLTDSISIYDLCHAIEMPDGYITPEGYYIASLATVIRSELSETVVGMAVAVNGKRAELRAVNLVRDSGSGQIYYGFGTEAYLRISP